MRIWLIRHFRTQGNLERRYIGRTDEPILPGQSRKYPVLSGEDHHKSDASLQTDRQVVVSKRAGSDL